MQSSFQSPDSSGHSADVAIRLLGSDSPLSRDAGVSCPHLRQWPQSAQVTSTTEFQVDFLSRHRIGFGLQASLFATPNHRSCQSNQGARLRVPRRALY